jgi:tripartite-type tricarboxylate transporter receptor subunit TctC
MTNGFLRRRNLLGGACALAVGTAFNGLATPAQAQSAYPSRHHPLDHSIQAYLKSGKLVPIGVPSGKRSPQYPDVPTFAESGFPNFDINSWVGLVAPAKTPAPILQRLTAELNAALNEPAVREQLATSGISASPGTAAGFADVIRNELALYGPVVKAAGIKQD